MGFRISLLAIGAFLFCNATAWAVVTNDECVDAIDVGVLPATILLDNTGATSDIEEPCGVISLHAAVLPVPLPSDPTPLENRRQYRTLAYMLHRAFEIDQAHLS